MQAHTEGVLIVSVLHHEHVYVRLVIHSHSESIVWMYFLPLKLVGWCKTPRAGFCPTNQHPCLAKQHRCPTNQHPVSHKICPQDYNIGRERPGVVRYDVYLYNP
jgi:hypothetical protein